MSNVPTMFPGEAGGGALAGWDKLFDGTVSKTNPGQNFNLTDGVVTSEMIALYDMLIIKVESSIIADKEQSKVYLGICGAGSASSHLSDEVVSFSAGETKEFRACKLATRKSESEWYLTAYTNSSDTRLGRVGDPLIFGLARLGALNGTPRYYAVTCDITLNVKLYGLKL